LTRIDHRYVADALKELIRTGWLDRKRQPIDRPEYTRKRKTAKGQQWTPVEGEHWTKAIATLRVPLGGLPTRQAAILALIQSTAKRGKSKPLTWTYWAAFIGGKVETAKTNVEALRDAKLIKIEPAGRRQWFLPLEGATVEAAPKPKPAPAPERPPVELKPEPSRTAVPSTWPTRDCLDGFAILIATGVDDATVETLAAMADRKRIDKVYLDEFIVKTYWTHLDNIETGKVRGRGNLGAYLVAKFQDYSPY
jgi:hypothetical protein